MKNYYNLSDIEFETQFEKASLPVELFSHEAHLRLAWIHIINYGEQKAIENIHDQLIAYVTQLNALAKYHETVTVSSIKMVHHFIKKSNSVSFKDFINDYPELNSHFKELLSSHYSIDVFGSAKAKTLYIQLDVVLF